MTTRTITYKQAITNKLNPSIIDKLSELIAKGNYAVVACQLCGVSESMYYRWINQGEIDIESGKDTIHSCLVQSIREAQAKAEVELVSVIRNAATIKKEFLPAIIALERMYPHRWGRRDKIDINNNQNITLTYKHIIQLAREYEEEQSNLIEGECKEITDGTNRV